MQFFTNLFQLNKYDRFQVQGSDRGEDRDPYYYSESVVRGNCPVFVIYIYF